MYSLCCISNELKDEGRSFETMTWKRFNDLRLEYGEKYALSQLGRKWLNNLVVTHFCIEHCYNNGWGYRISSDIFPLLTHPEFAYTMRDIEQCAEINQVFDDIATDNKSWNVRLSCHPDQFNVLASTNRDAVVKTVKELDHQAWVMDKMGCQRTTYNPINLHVNCNGSNLSQIADRFFAGLMSCHISVISRMVIENEDKGCWNVSNLLAHFHDKFRIPITFDNLHYKCNPCELSEIEAMRKCAETWSSTKPIKPLFHYSESDPNSKNPRAHAEFAVDFPRYKEYDWDIELKGKDLAIRGLAANEMTELSQSLGLYND